MMADPNISVLPSSLWFSKHVPTAAVWVHVVNVGAVHNVVLPVEQDMPTLFPNSGVISDFQGSIDVVFTRFAFYA